MAVCQERNEQAIYQALLANNALTNEGAERRKCGCCRHDACSVLLLVRWGLNRVVAAANRLAGNAEVPAHSRAFAGLAGMPRFASMTT
jgi:hypothetical protein